MFTPRFLKFLFVGGLNTAFGYGVFLLAFWFGMHYALAGGIATIVGVVFNYKTIGGYVFSGARGGGGRFQCFILVYAIVYVVNVLSIKFFLIFGVSVWFSSLFLLLPCACLSYILNKKYVF